MISILTELGAKSKSGQRKLYILVVDRKEKKRIPLDVAIDEQFVKNGKIANPLVATKVEQIRLKYQMAMLDISMFANGLSVERMAEELQKSFKDECGFKLDFIHYINICAERRFLDKKEKTAQGYMTAKRTLEQFVKEEYNQDEYDINDINKSFIQRYVDWGKRKGMTSATIERYIAYMSSVYNQAKDEYNDEDSGKSVITKSPFAKSTSIWRVPSVQRTDNKDNCLTAKALRYIFDLPMLPSIGGKPNVANVAKDAYFLSFGLCGMNAKDMLEIESLTDGMVKYKRSKTKDRSKFAQTCVEIPEQIRAIHERCSNFIPVRGRERRLWYFNQMYAKPDNFNHALNDGLRTLIDYAVSNYAEEKKISQAEAKDALGIKEGITFYSARHSWATIAENECGISIDIIDKGLCHAGDSIAKRSYIKDDWGNLNEANKKIMDYVLGKK